MKLERRYRMKPNVDWHPGRKRYYLEYCYVDRTKDATTAALWDKWSRVPEIRFWPSVFLKFDTMVNTEEEAQKCIRKFESFIKERERLDEKSREYIYLETKNG